jgi:iron complex outermembrane receptor protein
LKGFSQVSARISVGAWDQRWALTLGGSNLTDEKVLNQVLDTVFFPGSYNARQKSGRKVFASLSFAW